ncbi:MAG TPA: nuclear transport factor 2 family protein [Tepidisphaeraceae bacterium]|jgi:hypothetical protein|nr:nuclear transport factor 2 family protein [Tepidisphaeraceae bacterium]
MSLQSLAQEFVDLCNQGKNFDVMRAMYADAIISVEASGHETVGKQPVIQKSEKWGAANQIHGEYVRGPYFNGVADPTAVTSGQFAVHFTFELTPNGTGQRVKLEEVAIYTVQDEQIVREVFFYEGTR